MVNWTNMIKTEVLIPIMTNCLFTFMRDNFNHPLSYNRHLEDVCRLCFINSYWYLRQNRSPVCVLLAFVIILLLLLLLLLLYNVVAISGVVRFMSHVSTPSLLFYQRPFSVKLFSARIRVNTPVIAMKCACAECLSPDVWRIQPHYNNNMAVNRWFTF